MTAPWLLLIVLICTSSASQLVELSKPAEKIIFVRCFKVGGGTLQSILEAEAKRMNLRIATGSLEHPHILTLSYARRSKQHPDMITLHARYDDWMKRFIPGAIYITLVRHPLSRAISHFAHFNPISRNMTFNEFYRQFVSEKERLPRVRFITYS
eukprot:TRINITY_DN3010_c0_g1_i4.p1 TRINITY_DN3010_c0_g1~~TRINITY_DN3010_c0_g1_i4.p1  ORF type:complete len:154 (+),score=22.90 TRINITY_DN3010_c0_g1_i4:53-514(+)